MLQEENPPDQTPNSLPTPYQQWSRSTARAHPQKSQAPGHSVGTRALYAQKADLLRDKPCHMLSDGEPSPQTSSLPILESRWYSSYLPVEDRCKRRHFVIADYVLLTVIFNVQCQAFNLYRELLRQRHPGGPAIGNQQLTLLTEHANKFFLNPRLNRSNTIQGVHKRTIFQSALCTEHSPFSTTLCSEDEYLHPNQTLNREILVTW